MHDRNGFTMIEMILSLIIMAIIASVTALFFASGVSGYMMAKRGAELAPMAQNTLNRLSIELRSISEGDVTIVANTSISYQSTDSALSGNRVIRYDPDTDILYLTGADGTERVLMNNVRTFQLTHEETDMDPARTGNEISSINLSFQVESLPSNFTLKVLPREFVQNH